jgi:hypothetical protein
VPLGSSGEEDELLVGELVSVGHERGPVASDGTSRRHHPSPASAHIRGGTARDSPAPSPTTHACPAWARQHNQSHAVALLAPPVS